MTNKTQFKVGDIVEVIDEAEFKENVAAGTHFWGEGVFDENNHAIVDEVVEETGTIFLKDNTGMGGTLFLNEQQYIRKVGGQDV